MLTPTQGRPVGLGQLRPRVPRPRPWVTAKVLQGASVWDPRISLYLGSGRLSVAQTGSLKVNKVGVGLRSPQPSLPLSATTLFTCGLLSEDHRLTSCSPDFPKLRFPLSLSTHEGLVGITLGNANLIPCTSHTCMTTHAHMYTHTGTHTYTRACIHAHPHMYTYACAHAHMYARTVYTHMHAPTCAHTHACTHTHAPVTGAFVWALLGGVS